MFANLKLLLTALAVIASLQLVAALSAKGNCSAVTYTGSAGTGVPMSRDSIDKKSVVTQIFDSGDFQATTVTQSIFSGPTANQQANFSSGQVDRFITLAFNNGIPPVVYRLTAGNSCNMLYENQHVTSINIANATST